MAKHKLSTTVPLPRSLVRMGLTLDNGKGLFKILNTSEIYALLQTAWYQARTGRGIRQNQFIGFNARVTLEKALASLKKKRFIKYAQNTGYTIRFKAKSEEDTTYVWCWPLAFGHLSIKARIVLCFIDEYVDMGKRGKARYYVNRQHLMKSMGMSSSAFYRILNELTDAGLIIKIGKQVGRKGPALLVARRTTEWHDSYLDEICQSPDYLMRSERPGPYGEGHEPIRGGTRTHTERETQKGSPKGSLAGSPKGKRASLIGEGSLRQHIIRRCNVLDPTLLERRLKESQVLEKLNSLTEEEQLIIQTVHDGNYINNWTDAIREWSPTRYLMNLGATDEGNGKLTLYNMHPPHDIEQVKALVEAKPELRAAL